MSRITLAFFIAIALAETASAEPETASATVTVTKLPPLSFGLIGYAGADEALIDSASLRRYLTSKLGREVTTRVFPNPTALANAVATGAVDLAWLQPFTFIAAQAKGDVVALAKAVRHGLPFYRGVLFTKAGRAIGSLNDLQGLSVAWVDPSSAAGYLFTRAMIISAGLKPETLFKSETFSGDHAAVCKAVNDGTVDVGATFADDRKGGMIIDGCAQALGEEAAKGLKIIKTSEPIPNDAIVAKPGMEQAEMDRIAKAFLGLAKDKAGKNVLAGVFKADGFDVVDANDFMPVKFAAEAAERK